MKYWQLKNTEISLIDREPFLATTLEPDLSQACSFTPIPAKTNDLIF